jgi:hypothetical protein
MLLKELADGEKEFGVLLEERECLGHALVAPSTPFRAVSQTAIHVSRAGQLTAPFRRWAATVDVLKTCALIIRTSTRHPRLLKVTCTG